MASEDEQPTLRTRYELSEFDHDRMAAVFVLTVAPDHAGMLHHYALDLADWDYLGRPLRLRMSIEPDDPHG